MYQVLNYIQENIRTKLTISETAARFGYSRWYFCTKFHQLTGMTFVEYIRHNRIQLAALDILREKKISDVAFDYGYDTVGGFNKAFLKEYGCLPREYRKQNLEDRKRYERRRASMYQLTDRTTVLREEAVHLKSQMHNYALQRIVYFAIGGDRAAKQNKAPAEIFGAATANVLRSFSPSP